MKCQKLMINPHSKRLFHNVVKDAQTNGLVLFLGSGINGTALPQWDSLLSRLLEKTFLEVSHEDSRISSHNRQLQKWCKTHYDVCAQASIVKSMLGSERYRLEIQDALYGSNTDVEKEIKEYCKNPSTVRSNYEFLRTIAKLCSLPQVKAVATFNFDTLLECAISAIGKRRPRAYFGSIAAIEDDEITFKDIPIYHVHGLLSSQSKFIRNPPESIVFSYDEYFNKNADPYSWETATSLHLLRNYCTLWLGASLKDWNMLRLLHGAFEGRSAVRSYCVQCLQEVITPSGMKIEGIELQEFREAAMRIQATLFGSVGVNLIQSGFEYNDVPAAINHYIVDVLKSLLKKQEE